MPPKRPTRQASGSVILLDEDPARSTVPAKRTASKVTKKPGAVPQARKENHRPTATNPPDVIEISSDDDDDEPVQVPVRPSADKAEMARMAKRLKQLEQENAAFKQGLSELDDTACCEICSCTMGPPWILSECGHSFCQKCLVDWFHPILTRHRATYPQFNVNQAQRVNLYGYAVPQLPAPPYACPKCRTTIRQKPTKNFLAKAFTDIVVKLTKEKPSPKKAGAGAGVADPFSPFFAP
ncbi:RING-type domain-containing protein [Mycena chlorophos]|uniref:RING-type domain-containing protein n=1 Tax=Mycena chlorophos TaxID=658473 RepID=A0A8H6TPG4_MYCCL|nr:RING-type domain-containing protein [Mycena chlorophos]